MKIIKFNLLTVMVLLVTLTFTAYYVWWMPRPFESVSWKAATPGKEAIRFRMLSAIKALLNSGSIKSKADAEKSLGLPREVTDRNWRYSLGHAALWPKKYYLLLQFDEQGSLIRYGIHPD